MHGARGVAKSAAVKGGSGPVAGEPIDGRTVTLWSIVARHGASLEAARSAYPLLLDRYGGAVRRYLTLSLEDEPAADEAFRQFVSQLASGELHAAAQGQASFRTFAKQVLDRLPATRGVERADADAQFLRLWREELLARAWRGLRRVDERGGTRYAAALHCRVEHPEISVVQLAAQLKAEHAISLSADGVRQLLRRARREFAELLRDELAQSLLTPDPRPLDAELAALELDGIGRPL